MTRLAAREAHHRSHILAFVALLSPEIRPEANSVAVSPYLSGAVSTGHAPKEWESPPEATPLA